MGSGDDPVMRGLAGIGPARLTADSSKPDATIKTLDAQVALAKKWYLPYDKARKRVLIVSVPDNTFNPDGLRKIVTHFKADVPYWELRTNPTVVQGADFAGEIKVFAGIVKSVDPGLKVLGPGAITLHWNDLKWIEDFLKNDPNQTLDGFSFVNDEGVVGDLWLARTSLEQTQHSAGQVQSRHAGKMADGAGVSRGTGDCLRAAPSGALDDAPKAGV